MVVGHNAEFGPAVDDSEQTEVVVLELLLGHLAETELVEQIITQQQLMAVVAHAAKDSLARSVHAAGQLVAVAGEHQLEQVRDRLGVLLDLLLGGRVEDGEAGVDVPLVCVDAQRDVHLYVFNAANVAGRFPGELVICGPRGAHAEEGGVRHGLRVGRDAVVLLAREVHVLGAQARQDVFDKGKVGVGRAVLDEDQWLALWVDAGPVERVARHDADVAGQVLLKGGYLGRLARRLASDDGAELGG